MRIVHKPTGIYSNLEVELTLKIDFDSSEVQMEFNEIAKYITNDFEEFSNESDKEDLLKIYNKLHKHLFNG
jgi:hypothetical protein